MTEQTPTDAELLPCPFCGAPALGYAIKPHSHSPAVLRLVPELPDHPGSYVIEGQCACGSGLIGANEAEVVARWNTRWGSPVVAGEPVAAHRVMRKRLDGEWACDGRYWCDGPPSKELVESISSDKDRWRVDVAYATPQPTQAQAGAVPQYLHICNLWLDPKTQSYVVDHCDHPPEECLAAYIGVSGGITKEGGQQ